MQHTNAKYTNIVSMSIREHLKFVQIKTLFVGKTQIDGQIMITIIFCKFLGL